MSLYDVLCGYCLDPLTHVTLYDVLCGDVLADKEWLGECLAGVKTCGETKVVVSETLPSGENKVCIR